MVRGRFLAGILAAGLLCTAVPETAYAVEGAVQPVQKQVETGDDSVSKNDTVPQEQEKEQPEDGETEGMAGKVEELSELSEGGEEVETEMETTVDQTALTRAATESIAQLKERFPAGKYWKRVNLLHDNSDGVTSTPCPANHDTAPNTCNNYRGYAQCWGFAYRLADGYYGSCPLDGWGGGTLDSLKGGDIVQYGGGTFRHTIWVTGVNGDTV